MDLMNAELNNLLAKYFPAQRQASNRYYTDKHGNRYFYTVDRINCGCKQMPARGHYVCGKYRFFKQKRLYKLTKKRCFAKKYKAIDWAREQCRKSDNKQ